MGIATVFHTIWFYFNYLRSFPVYLCVRTSQHRACICEDVKVWWENCSGMVEIDCARKAKHLLPKLNWLLIYKQEFRNLLIYRLKQPPKSLKSYLHFVVTRLFWKPMDSLYLPCEEIGPGFFIQHGFASMIGPRKMGAHCFVNQQVTIGYKGYDAPVLEDYVIVHSGAQVLGGITLHKNCEVGAGAVVVHDVPENAIVAGVPAKVIKYRPPVNS